MNKPLNPATDRRYQELSLELESVNAQIHRLRLKARKLNEEFLGMKATLAPPKPTVSTSTSPKSSKSKSKLLAQDDDLMLGGVSD